MATDSKAKLELSGQPQHDSIDGNGYKKRCYCERCVATYNEFCRKKKEEGCTVCKRRCYTVCEILCEKPVTTIFNWGYEKKYEGKWEPFIDNRPHPRPCKKCALAKKDCTCNK